MAGPEGAVISIDAPQAAVDENSDALLADQISRVRRDEIFGSLNDLAPALDEPPVLHVMDGDKTGLPYATGIVPRLNGGARKVAPLFVVRLTELRQGGGHNE